MGEPSGLLEAGRLSSYPDSLMILGDAFCAPTIFKVWRIERGKQVPRCLTAQSFLLSIPTQ